MKLHAVLTLLLAVACAPARTPQAPPPVEAEKPKPEPEAPVVPADVVARAAGNVSVVRLSDGEVLAPAAVARELLGYEAICAGEEHTSAAQHYAELWLLEKLAQQAPNQGLEFGTGFEMWPTKDQGVLAAFSEGRINEKRLLKSTQYAKVWGYDFAYYRPIVTRARELSVPLVALNASPTLAERVAKKGLAALDDWTSERLPELDMNDAEHRADFERRMKGHPGTDAKSLDNYYAAQVLWDETMADAGVRWLNLHSPVRRLLIVAGQAHCQRSAIPKRAERRGVHEAAALLLAAERPKSDAAAHYDYAVIVTSNEP